MEGGEEGEEVERRETPKRKRDGGNREESREEEWGEEGGCEIMALAVGVQWYHFQVVL